MKIRFHNFWRDKGDYFPLFHVATGLDETVDSDNMERFVDFGLLGFYMSFTFRARRQ